jgi:hypothetical protein
MVGERGFEPPTPWSRTNNRCTKLLSRLGLFCVLYRLFAWYSGTNGPNIGLKFSALDVADQVRTEHANLQ